MIAKYVHVASVIATFILFFIRGIWMISDSDLLQRKWTRRVPPVIDTILLASAIVLSVTIYQYPFVHAWLTSKVVALFLYIGLGMLALTYGKTKPVRISAWVAAQFCFIYIAAVAITKNPLVLL
ncbi:MAG: invasion regulator SirB2 [Gammaproteobacteria bacterium]|nr:MAG: invasion regulator SirB2 [Gammaproteobacteria bacterium]